MDEVNGNTSKRPEQKGWDVSARGQEDELATDGKRRDYIYTHTQAPTEGDQGGGRRSGRRMKPHKQGRGIWKEMRGKYTKQEQGQNYNMDSSITDCLLSKKWL